MVAGVLYAQHRPLARLRAKAAGEEHAGPQKGHLILMVTQFSDGPTVFWGWLMVTHQCHQVKVNRSQLGQKQRVLMVE